MPSSKTLPQVLIITPRRKLQQEITPISPRRKEGREGNYGAEKMTKINFVRLLVTSFVKSHRLCALHCFGFCSVEP